MNTRDVPWPVYKHLRAGFVAHWAHWQLMTLRRQRGYIPGDVVHPGDPLGTVLAWLWEEDPDEAAILVADYMACLRDHDELVDPDSPRVRFDDLLRCLHMAMPNGFTETDSLVARLCADVPGYYGDDDLNT